MLTSRFVAAYGWVSLAIMAALLALMWLKVIPESLYLPMFIIAIVLFSGRLILRIMEIRQQRRSENIPEE